MYSFVAKRRRLASCPPGQSSAQAVPVGRHSYWQRGPTSPCVICAETSTLGWKIVLAAVGLERLGMPGEITEMLDYGVFLPAPGQGALGIQTRTDDTAVIKLAAALNDEATNVATRTERMLLERLGGDCKLPMGALARAAGTDGLSLSAVVISPDGSRVIRTESTGTMQNPTDLVDKCFGDLSRQGVAKLIP